MLLSTISSIPDNFDEAIKLLHKAAFHPTFQGAIQTEDHQGVCIEACRQLEAFRKFLEEKNDKSR